MMRERRTLIVEVTRIDVVGIEVRELTCNLIVSTKHFFLLAAVGIDKRTRAIYTPPGKPRSLANDQSIREAAANSPTSAQSCMITIMEIITAAPLVDPVAASKTSIKGYPVGESCAFFMSPRQNSIAIIIESPREPFMRMLVRIERGTTLDAPLISSDIWNSQSSI